MKNIYKILLLFLIVSGACRKQVTTSDLLSPLTFSSKQVIADGSSLITVETTLNQNTDPTFRNVLFNCSAGSFIGGTDSTAKAAATFVNERLLATVQFKAPLVPGEVIIKAKILLPNEIHDYTQQDSIAALASVPSKISLSSSSFAVEINFGSEVTVTGLLANMSGKSVSLHNKVGFYDHYDDNTPVDGRFRQLETMSNSSSSVSAIYSPGAVLVGRNIWIVGILLDTLGHKTNIKDSVLISTISN